MIKKSFLLLICMLGICSAHAEPQANGGAGISQDGRVMTFYSAGIVVKKEEESLANIPGLSEMMQTIHAMPYLTPQKSLAYLSGLRPGVNRKYYRVLEKYLDDTTTARILAEYSRITKLARNDIRLLAVTDSNSKTTYLFPDFYRLQKFEQMAILFHEGFWIANPNSTYEKVVSAEVAMQRYLESARGPEQSMGLIEEIGTIRDYVKTGLTLDLKSGALKPLLDKNGHLPLVTLLGPDTISCLRNEDGADCNQEFLYSLMSLSMTYPNSFFLKALSDASEASNGLPIREIRKVYGEYGRTAPTFELLRTLNREDLEGPVCRRLRAQKSIVNLKMEESLTGFEIKTPTLEGDFEADGAWYQCAKIKMALIVEEGVKR